ncbi:MAG: DNA polymerase III subunit beta [Chloroflexi bacterium]|nr:DNA polymerase III subunit beta [Chloroflexota bacterium]
MKIKILAENLARGLRTVSRTASLRSTLPVLGNVLMATDEGRLCLTTTNLETTTICWIDALIEQDGAITVPAHTLTDLVSTFPPEQVDLELDSGTQTLNVRCGGTRTRVKGIEAGEFPPLPEPGPGPAIEIPAADLKELIRKVSVSAASDQGRPVLTGVLVAIDGNTITLAAADGFRLSEGVAVLSSPAPKPVQAILPAQALDEWVRITGEGEMVAMSFTNSRAVFKTERLWLATQVIEGSFPDYKQIIPAEWGTRAVLSTEAFTRACKRAAIFARENPNSNTVVLNVNGTVEVSGKSDESGSSRTVIDGEATTEGEALKIAFNVRYLLDILKVLDTPNVAIEMSSNTNPGVIRPVGVEDFLHVVMPLALSGGEGEV